MSRGSGIICVGIGPYVNSTIINKRTAQSECIVISQIASCIQSFCARSFADLVMYAVNNTALFVHVLRGLFYK